MLTEVEELIASRKGGRQEFLKRCQRGTILLVSSIKNRIAAASLERLKIASIAAEGGAIWASRWGKWYETAVFIKGEKWI